ncbi:ParB N-terminal domain-containing protein [Pleurocapsales cyanobacterium LEGE 10410]|nr:ParB N-terminal domain-containing protein [Pleurocapsales cyanobacterium LEGE 10410]
MSTIEIERIKVKSARRSLKPEKVAELKESIAVNGLLNPITVDQDLNLIAGLHRLTACTMLGFKEIECNIIDYEDDRQSRLAEIDENLIRSELEALERAELWLEREKILANMGLRAKPGDNQHARKQESLGRPVKTTEELAKETGYTKRTYQYGKQIASKILPEVKQVIRGTKVAKKTTALLEIARAGSEEYQKADVAEKAARQAKTAGNNEEAHRQAMIVAKARAKQKELQLSTLAEIQAKKAKAATEEKVVTEAKLDREPGVKVGDEWLLGRHLVYCGDPADQNFINLAPSEVALAIATTADWNYNYLVDKARVVAVVLEQGQIYNFCTHQQMPFQFELLVGKSYIGIFSHQSLTQPRQPTEIEGIEGIVSYLVAQYTNRNLGLFVVAPNLGNGEVLITCERMGRICFAGDRHPQTVSRAISRWQNWTKKSAVRENQTKLGKTIPPLNGNLKPKIFK